MAERIIHPFRSRKLEWWLASTTAAFGIWLYLPVNSMQTRAFWQLSDWMDEHQWAFLFLTTGIAHLLALYINGSKWWTPMVRFIMLLFNIGAYTGFTLGFLLFYWPTTATFTYGALTVSGLICLWTAVEDSVHAIRIRYATRFAKV